MFIEWLVMRLRDGLGVILEDIRARVTLIWSERPSQPPPLLGRSLRSGRWGGIWR